MKRLLSILIAIVMVLGTQSLIQGYTPDDEPGDIVTNPWFYGITETVQPTTEAPTTQAPTIAPATTAYVKPYELDKSTGTLKITNQAVLEDSDTGIMPWNADKAYIKKVIISSGITSIGKKNFYGLPNLESIVLPNKLLRIGDSAFENCKYLNNVNLPSSLTRIGERSFYGCNTLSRIVVPKNVKVLGKYSFSLCKSLQSAVLNNNPSIIPEGLFKGCENLGGFVFPKSVKKIDDAAFYGCESITKLVIPSGITGVGNEAYRDCLGLTYVEIPLSVIWIGSNAFKECDSLVAASYLGNKNEWSFVYVGGGNDNLLSGLTFHVCAYTKVRIIKPAYTSKGYTIHICGVCGKKYIDSYVDALQNGMSITKAKAKKKSIKLTWKRVKGVTGYKIQYSLKKNFKKSKTLTIKNAATTSKVLKKLKKKKKYYIRIRSYTFANGKTYESRWSKVKVKKTK